MLARSPGLVTSLSAALGSWIALAPLSRSVDRTLPGAAVLNIIILVICIPLGRGYRGAPMPAAIRRWYDIPLRAAMVATLVAIVVAVSSRVGPTVTGILALFPVVLTSLVLIFQPRIGGPATATITANAIPRLAGYGLALLVLNLSAIRAGTPAALALALAVSIRWNLIILGLRRPGIVIRQRLGGPPSRP